MTNRHPRQRYSQQATGRCKGHVIWPLHLDPLEDGLGRKLPVVELDEAQFFWLLVGLDLKHLKPQRALEYRTVL